MTFLSFKFLTIINISRIWRKEPAESKVHFFTSHFFTTLQENDVQGVSSWTVKKKIDVFNKSFIFLPINEYLHWSLCVVVNPGEIMNSLVSFPITHYIYSASQSIHKY